MAQLNSNAAIFNHSDITYKPYTTFHTYTHLLMPVYAKIIAKSTVMLPPWLVHLLLRLCGGTFPPCTAPRPPVAAGGGRMAGVRKVLHLAARITALAVLGYLLVTISITFVTRCPSFGHPSLNVQPEWFLSCSWVEEGTPAPGRHI